MHTPSIECRLSGDAREMGIGQGSALRAGIVGLRQALRGLDAFRLEQPAWMPYPLFLRLAERKLAKMLAPALRRDDPVMLARLEGIAEGARVPLRSLCLLNALEALLSTVRGRTVPAAPGACSALAVRGGGEPVIARNFDYLPLIEPFLGMRECRPRGGFRSLEFSAAPLAGCIDGVNERGLAITLNYAFVLDEGRPAPLITMAIAEALARYGTVEEAVAFLAGRPRWGAGILMLADASGDIASVELSNTREAVRRPPPGQDWLLFTNVCSCADTCAVQVPAGSLFSGRVPAALRGMPVLEWHAARARRIEELVGQGSRELAEILADHGPQGVPDGTSPCVHTDYWSTVASLQWFPASRRVRVSYGTACAARYVEMGL